MFAKCILYGVCGDGEVQVYGLLVFVVSLIYPCRPI